MNSQQQQQEPVQLLTKFNFTSQFFSNFINDTSIDHTQSYISNSSIEHYQFSVNEQKFKMFHAENLINIWWTIKKRNTIQKWILNKQIIKNLEKRTPNYLTKTLLKIFYTIAVKLQVKYSFAFRKISKYSQESNHKIAEGNKENKNKMEKLKDGLEKMINLFELFKNNSINKLFMRDSFNLIKQMKKQSQFQRNQLIDEEYLINYNENWKKNHHKNTLFSKIQILLDTLNLVLHLKMRQAFLNISIFKQSLQQNNISHIEPQNNNKQCFKINNSIEGQMIQKQLFDQNLPQLPLKIDLPIYSNSKQNENIEIVADLRDQKKQQVNTNQFIDKHNPKHLKFSKDTKRKLLKQGQSLNRDFYQNVNNNSFNNVHIGNNSINYNNNSQNVIEKSLNKSHIQENSFTKRNSIINTSDYHSKSFVKKIYYPIEFNVMKSYKNITILQQNDLPPQMNEGTYRKSFQNVNNATKVRQLKQLQLRNQFTDFNDLFFMRQMGNIFEQRKGIKIHTTQHSPKKSISLAKIKQKVNKKTTQQYFQKHKKSVSKPFNQFITERIMPTEPSIDYAVRNHRSSMKKSQYSHKNLDVSKQKINIFSTRKKIMKQQQNRQNLRIPSKLPLYFDYYVDKQMKKSQNVCKQQKILYQAEQRPSILKKRKSSLSKSNKKIFNTVKSSLNRLSTDIIDRRKKNTQIKSFISPLFNQKVEGENLSKSKFQFQKKVSKDEDQKKLINNMPNGEYYIGFRDPPKKKMKKNL